VQSKHFDILLHHVGISSHGKADLILRTRLFGVFYPIGDQTRSQVLRFRGENTFSRDMIFVFITAYVWNIILGTT